MAIMWIVSTMASAAGALITIGAALRAASAADISAGAALGVACATIPYCLARGLDALFGREALMATDAEPPRAATTHAGR
jgi:hypothetical protein